MDAKLLSIGRLAAATGVPVKTIRYYSDIGVLPPQKTTPAGYRLYAEDDRLKLELIRTLRALDFDLASIAGVLKRSGSAREALALQLGAVDAALKNLTRVRAVLKASLSGGGEVSSLEALRRLDALSRLAAMERGAFLRAALDEPLRGIPIDQRWKAQLYDAAFAELPEELSEAQWSALFELAEILADPEFGRRLAEGARSFWTEAAGKFDAASFSAEMFGLIGEAAAALNAGEPPRGERAGALAERLVAVMAAARGRRPSRVFAREMLAGAARHDPRAERFWELVAILRGWPPPPHARAFRFLLAALAEKVGPARGEATRRSTARSARPRASRGAG